MTPSRSRSLLVLGLALVVGCTEDPPVATEDPPDPPDRPRMGITYFQPVLLTGDATRFTSNLVTRADVLPLHLDVGVPWEIFGQCAGDPGACDLSADPALETARDGFVAVVDDLASTAAAFDGPVFLSMTILNGHRDGLADNFFTENDAGAANGPPGPDFADPAVRDVVLRYAEYLRGRLNPTYFAPGIEVTMYVRGSPADWDDLLSLLAELKADALEDDPSLIVSPSVQWEFYLQSWDGPAAERTALEGMIEDWDLYGNATFFSVYPHIFDPTDPDPVSSDHLDFPSYGFDFDAAARVMIAEAGVNDPAQPSLIHALHDLDRDVDLLAMTWFFLEDLEHLPLVQTTFANAGLFDDTGGDLTPNAGLAVWDSLFAAGEPVD